MSSGESEESEYDGRDKYRSPLWYLAPIIVGIAGGVIAFLALRRDAPNMSKLCLVTGGLFELVFFITFEVLLFDECSVLYGYLRPW